MYGKVKYRLSLSLEDLCVRCSRHFERERVARAFFSPTIRDADAKNQRLACVCVSLSFVDRFFHGLILCVCI